MSFWPPVCPLMKPAQNLQKNSPADLEKQTAIASKDKGIFLTELLLCQQSYVSQPPTHFDITCFAHY